MPIQGPLPDHPELDRMLAISYAAIRIPGARAPVTDAWLCLRSLLKAARAADQASPEEELETLAAAIGEIIADMSGERQQELIQGLIHGAFLFAGHLRTPGFDQPHGIAGHA